jgi:hypothetical protein
MMTLRIELGEKISEVECDSGVNHRSAYGFIYKDEDAFWIYFALLHTLRKSVRENIEHLHGAKIIGDIAGHDSKIAVEEPDVNLALPHFRVLLKSVTTV